LRAKDKIAIKAALWFAEIGDIPKTYRALKEDYPKGKPDVVLRRTWGKFYRSWDVFIDQVSKLAPELSAIAQEPVQDEPVEESKDPLEALRASTVEK
tara:strand:- start:174 stop:464 length:291 start_codon:yes stop_codon:yes gene_type:complete